MDQANVWDQIGTLPGLSAEDRVALAILRKGEEDYDALMQRGLEGIEARAAEMKRMFEAPTEWPTVLTAMKKDPIFASRVAEEARKVIGE